MSSQGPSTGTRQTPEGANECYGPTGTSQVPPGYPFSTKSIRDASDWISYKKQTRIIVDPKLAKAKDPWFVHGNNFRLDYLNGENKCGSCDGNAFGGDVDYSLITIDFTNSIEGDFPEGRYVLYTIPEPTTVLRFKFINMPLDPKNVEIDSASFNFREDGSTLLINSGTVHLFYDIPYFSQYCIYSESNLYFLQNRDIVTLQTNTPISGYLYIGYYINQHDS